MKPVAFSDLSDIELTMFVASSERHETPDFLLLKYSGHYGIGSNGSDDAKFIVATSKAAHSAWYTEGVIIDFSKLDYRWGDEMSWVFDIGWCPVTGCQHPLSIIVGDNCVEGLRSLAKDSYENTCVDSLDKAKAMIRTKADDYERCLQEWRDEDSEEL